MAKNNFAPTLFDISQSRFSAHRPIGSRLIAAILGTICPSSQYDSQRDSLRLIPGSRRIPNSKRIPDSWRVPDSSGFPDFSRCIWAPAPPFALSIKSWATGPFFSPLMGTLDLLLTYVGPLCFIFIVYRHCLNVMLVSYCNTASASFFAFRSQDFLSIGIVQKEVK